MRVHVIEDPFGVDALRVEERPMPVPGPREVLVRMRAVSLNYRDVLIVNGRWRAESPRVPISDGTGEVVTVGEEVRRLAVGDRVAGTFYPHWIDGPPSAETLSRPLGGVAADGVLAEYVLFGEDAAVRVPHHLTNEQAATLPCAGVTAWHAIIERGDVSEGDTVLVQGTGGVSLFAMQFALMRKAKVIVTSGSDAKLARARALGATWTTNHRVAPDWDVFARECTGGRGVDHVVEVVGADNLNRSLQAIRMGGTISLVGMLQGTSAPIETFQMAEKLVRLNGIDVGSRAMFAKMNEALVKHRIEPVVDRVFERGEVAAAFRHLTSGRHFGKVVLKM